MPQKRKLAKRVGVDLERLVLLFGWSDGTDSPLDSVEPLDPFTARQLWPEVRAAVWADWVLSTYPGWPEWPPGGAVAYDGFGERTYRARVSKWFHADAVELEGQRSARAAAAEADVADLDRWIDLNPIEAEKAAGPVELHRVGLLTVRDIAVECTTYDETRQAEVAAHEARKTMVDG